MLISLCQLIVLSVSSFLLYIAVHPGGLVVFLDLSCDLFNFFEKLKKSEDSVFYVLFFTGRGLECPPPILPDTPRYSPLPKSKSPDSPRFSPILPDSQLVTLPGKVPS